MFLGYQVSRQQNISEETSRKIDTEIRRLVEAGYAEAQQILTEKRADLETLAKGLLEFETLTGDEIKDLLDGKRPMRESVIEPSTPRSSAVPTAGKGRRGPEPARPAGAAAAGVIQRSDEKTYTTTPAARPAFCLAFWPSSTGARLPGARRGT